MRQVRQHSLMARIERRSCLMAEVTESGHLAASVGAHRWPYSAVARVGRPLSPEAVSLLVENRLEAFVLEPPRCGKTRRTGADDRDLGHNVLPLGLFCGRYGGSPLRSLALVLIFSEADLKPGIPCEKQGSARSGLT